MDEEFDPAACLANPARPSDPRNLPLQLTGRHDDAGIDPNWSTCGGTRTFLGLHRRAAIPSMANTETPMCTPNIFQLQRANT